MVSAVFMQYTWTIVRHDGPYRLGLWYNARPEHPMALIASECVFKSGGQVQVGLEFTPAVLPRVHVGRVALRGARCVCLRTAGQVLMYKVRLSRNFVNPRHRHCHFARARQCQASLVTTVNQT